MAEVVVRFDMDGPPYQLIFTEELITIKDAIVTPAGEEEVETTFQEADLENLEITQLFTEEAIITLGATAWRLYRDAGEWTITELVSP